MRIIHNNIEDTLTWENPIDNSKIELGQMIAKDMIINPGHKEFLANVLPLKAISFERLLGKGSQGEVYLSKIGDKKIAFKKYDCDDFCSGLTQFRCLRKIKILGYETPEVYVATNDILLMDYIPHPTIRDYIHNKNTAENMGRIFEVWYPQMIKIRSILWDENLDIKDGNGYVIQDTPEVKIGIFDQG